MELFDEEEFQSPKSGQICLNHNKARISVYARGKFQSPKSGQICLNSLKDYPYKRKTNKFP